MTSYQRLDRESVILDELGYNAVNDHIYTMESEVIKEWTRFFTDRAYQVLDFSKFHKEVPRSNAKAVAVSTQWYQFSAFMPYFLCQAAAFMSTNEKRHYVIQTAFEELGMRDVDEIHPEMFKQCCVEAGIPGEMFQKLSAHEPVQALLLRLNDLMLASQDDDYIMGMLLGLELPAEDNISSIFHSCAFDSTAEAKLRTHKFFKLHMALECEHVRLTVSNFLRFSLATEAKNQFIAGFDEGIRFWVDYWQEMSHFAIGLSIANQES